MPTTRRLLEAQNAPRGPFAPRACDSDSERGARRRVLPNRRALLALVTGLSSIVASTASCSSSDAEPPTPIAGDVDGGLDAAPDEDGGDLVDGGVPDAFAGDAAPLPIVCDEPPCAVALTTTSGVATEEGYCALLSDRTVACWGSNGSSQLGNPGIKDSSALPVRVPGVTNVSRLERTCAVDGDGDAHCWGRGAYLQGDPSGVSVEPTAVRLPLPGPAEKVAIGVEPQHALGVGCALMRDRSLLCWGSNYAMQLGSEISTSTRNAPPTPITGLDNPRDVVLVDSSSGVTFVIEEDGTLKSWGQGILGRPIAAVRDPAPWAVGISPVSMVATAELEACAVASGVGWCWGISDGYGPRRALPSAVDVPEPVVRIATSRSVRRSVDGNSYMDRRRWCATTSSGAVYCWGLNNAGQAGTGTQEFALTPVKVVGLPAPAAEVKIMPYSSCALLTNGRVYCWGSNMNGQLGADLPRGVSLEPVKVKLP